jgi:hypothetical protein
MAKPAKFIIIISMYAAKNETACNGLIKAKQIANIAIVNKNFCPSPM